ncbi:type III-B CRISPR module RAMP protein Cmr6 [Aceticella autotrophica]|uniref:Type III-B CRISPR module RAMP protein Cmr6 n=1 Tax=Aceticella autotrophica TaxID=2755338 RepID=A0A975AW63_9THEO|nr:type III-B CRISPR module RAMP protein Cmr6 [Aceticella autotrophica]QSZ27589.1 type III-B CRISPR module RAMP protein Cmr6 [Aceticella autotrophica]
MFKEIEKYAEYEWNKRKNREKEKCFNYKSSEFLKNPALIFGRLIPYPDDSDGKDSPDNKQECLELVVGEMEKLNEEINNRGFSIAARYGYAVKGLETYGFKTRNLQLSLLWRIIVGLGASHPQETSMTLHHIYGIPYIPGSAVKGITRHWVILNKFNNDEQKALKNEEFKEIFGTQEKEGEVIFFDAYTCGKIKLVIDIMNPHYSKYYSGLESPTDYQSPNPIKFLALEKTKFNFYVASKNKKLLSIALDYLKEALLQHGIGAKTSIGYGFFKV